MGLQNWSTTPADNATAAPNINMQTGSAPSTVHPSIRQLMADVATWYADPEWVAQADTPTYINATSFSVPTNRTSVYSVGRRVQAIGTGYTINGTITSSAYTSLTTVVVQWDSGALDNTVSNVAVGLLQNSLNFLQSGSSSYAQDTGTANALVASLSPAPAALSSGMSIRVHVATDNTGASTLNLNGLGALPINGLAGAALQGGELKAGAVASFILSDDKSHWVLTGCEFGALQVEAASQSNQAVNLGQFANSLADNGYQKLPSGLIIQFGSVSPSSANVQTTFNFPITFPTAAFQIYISSVNGGTSFVGSQGYIVNSSQGSLLTQTANTLTSWLAIGY